MISYIFLSKSLICPLTPSPTNSLTSLSTICPVNSEEADFAPRTWGKHLYTAVVETWELQIEESPSLTSVEVQAVVQGTESFEAKATAP